MWKPRIAESFIDLDQIGTKFDDDFFRVLFTASAEPFSFFRYIFAAKMATWIKSVNLLKYGFSPGYFRTDIITMSLVRVLNTPKKKIQFR